MESIAIIGTGIAGMGCGHFLHPHYQLEFYEQNTHIGGHTNTVYVEEGERQVPVDTGFIVFNKITYPNLVRLFERINVDIKPTDMSFGVQYLPTGLEYSSKKLFAQPLNYLNPRFFRMLLQISRFHRESEGLLRDDRYSSQSLKEYVREKNYSEDFLYQYLVPMTSALWSTPTDITLQYPVRVLVQFFKNHGLLGTDTQFQWYTVSNGSWQYRDKLIAPFRDRIRTNCAAVRVIREHEKVKITGSDGTEREFDNVIFACHADQALRILADPTDQEQTLLAPFQYQKNIATLHSDDALMPKTRATWSAWNYRVEEIRGELTATTIYDMNCLQQVSDKTNYFVSINDPGRINPAKVIRTIAYEHPIFTTRTADVQGDLSLLNTHGTSYFCGSYFRFGFHEDALTSAVAVCAKLLKNDPWEARPARNPGILVSS
jgi:predicted NAD/FAD-binding protein